MLKLSLCWIIPYSNRFEGSFLNWKKLQTKVDQCNSRIVALWLIGS